MGLKLLTYYDDYETFAKDQFNIRTLQEVFYLAPNDDFYVRIAGITNEKTISAGVGCFLRDLRNKEGSNFKHFFSSFVKEKNDLMKPVETLEAWIEFAMSTIYNIVVAGGGTRLSQEKGKAARSESALAVDVYLRSTQIYCKAYLKMCQIGINNVGESLNEWIAMNNHVYDLQVETVVEAIMPSYYCALGMAPRPLSDDDFDLYNWTIGLQ